MPGRLFVDDLLRFDPPLAADYSGAWEDDRTLLVTLDTAPQRQPCVREGCKYLTQAATLCE